MFGHGLRIALLIVCLYGFSAGATARCAEPLPQRFDFPALPGGIIIGGAEQKGQAATEAMQNGKKMLRIEWDAARARFLELMLKTPIILPEFSSAQAEIAVYLPEASSALRLGLRLIDSEGEIFQFTGHLREKNADGKSTGTPIAGLRKVQVLLNPRTAVSSWGGSNNKVLDFPVKVFGMGLDFVQDSGKSWLALGEVTVTPLPDTRCAANYILHHFDRMDLWSAQYPGGTGTLTPGNNGLTVAAKSERIILREKKWDMLTHERPVAFRLHAQLLSGQASAQLILQGPGGQRATTAPVALAAGQNQLRLDAFGPEFAKIAGRVRIVALVFLTPGKEAQLLVQELSKEILQEPLEAVTAEAETGHPFRLLLPGQEKDFAIRITNHSTRSVSLQVTAVLNDSVGRSTPLKHNVQIAPGATSDWRPGWVPPRLGLWRLRCELREMGMEDGNPAVRESVLAAMKPAGPSPAKTTGFLFGLCSHTENWSQGEQELEAMAAGLSGAKIIRTGQVWTLLQPEAGRWNWTGLDHLVELYGKEGIELQYIFMFPPRWACPPEVRKSTNWKDIMRSAPESAPWKEFVRTIITRYQGKIRYWEVWNEPDLTGFASFSSEEYVRLLKEAFEATRQTDPQARLMTGGFATLSEHGGRKDKDFQENALRGGNGFFDVHAYHEHGPFATFARLVEEKFLPLRAAAGVEKTPWYANETAINSSWTGEAGQATTLFKKLLFSWSRGAIGYNWYDLRNDGFDQHDPENSFGLLTHDFRPKAAYPAYAALAGEYAGATYIRQLAGSRGLWALHFQKESDQLLPCWNERAAPAENMLIRTDAKSAERIDLMGNRSESQLHEGMALLEFGAEPTTLRLKSATRAEPAGTLLAIGGEQYLAPGKQSSLRIHLRNPFATQTTFRLNLSLPAGVKTDTTLKQIEIAPGDEQTVEYRISSSASGREKLNEILSARLNFSVTGANWRSVLEVPLSRALVINAKNDFSGAEDFKLNQRAQIVPLFANDPNSLHLLWKGADDLSASIWLRTDGERLYLKVMVRDEQHRQPFSGSELWKGDSLQFAMQKAGNADYWEIGAALRDDGVQELFVWNAPQAQAEKNLRKKSGVKVIRVNDGLDYELELPMHELGFDTQSLREGIRFNLLVNDNDTGVREGWAELAPRLGRDKNPALFPLLVFTDDTPPHTPANENQ